MTYNELKNDVAGLGFEPLIEDEDGLIAAANRALRLIYTDRPVSRTVRRYVQAPRVADSYPVIRHEGGTERTVALSGVAFSFRARGRGAYLLKDGKDETRVEFNGTDTPIKSRMKVGGNITFLGEYDYVIYDLCSFFGVVGPEYDDIPLRELYIELDTDLEHNDFRAFVGPPRDARGEAIRGAVLRGGRIYLPFDYDGEIVYDYYRSPSEITRGGEQSIDVSAECEVLLPLLTAAFIWLDDDAQKASYYLSLYREELARILRYSRQTVDNSYSTDGWA